MGRGITAICRSHRLSRVGWPVAVWLQAVWRGQLPPMSAEDAENRAFSAFFCPEECSAADNRDVDIAASRAAVERSARLSREFQGMHRPFFLRPMCRLSAAVVILAAAGCVRPAYQRPQGFSASYREHLLQRFPSPMLTDLAVLPDSPVLPPDAPDDPSAASR